MKKLRKGFTLIEMLVVVAIISILAGIVLTGVTGFQANARDTKRIADLKQIQNYLELYYNRFGHYPGTAAGAVGAPANWDALVTALGGLGVTVPSDPLGTRDYWYATDAADNTHYILGARLERDNNALRRPEDLDSADVTAKATLYGITYAFTSGSSAASCEDTAPSVLGYCIE